MSQYQSLNKERHRRLRIKSGCSAALGNAVMHVMTYPMEFRDIQGSYPILFTKDPNTGGFFAVALLGLEAEQNLFLQGDRWDATYIPVMVQRQPFLLATGGKGDDKPPVVSLDLEHPRVSEIEGEALFGDDGEPTQFLRQKLELLEKLHRGLQHGSGFIEALLQHQLLVQVVLDLAFADGGKKTLQGFYCIAEERLYELQGDVLASLNKSGYLQPVFMAVASLSRVRDLIERRNRLRV
jgi:SapC